MRRDLFDKDENVHKLLCEAFSYALASLNVLSSWIRAQGGGDEETLGILARLFICTKDIAVLHYNCYGDEVGTEDLED